VALSYQPGEIERLRFAPDPCGHHYVGVVPYDGQAPTRVFAVDQALVVDHVIRRAYLTGGAALPETAPLPPTAPDLTLSPERPAGAYRAMVAQALADIRSGRYYQINLLRYFSVAHRGPDRDWLLARLRDAGGPMAALVDVPDLTVASFSPERFVAVETTAAGLTARTYPIKGTAPRHADPVADAAAGAALAASPKDRAELNMIVDLMRNDLRRAGVSGSVSVPRPGALVSHAHVHHLEACIEARLPIDTTVADLLRAVCPAGSITGAPKREVMAAIADYEGRPRGYLMGNAFWLDASGHFDSSVLIRTLVRQGGRDDAYTYGAGSGIVTLSDPEAERLEIAAKCRVVGHVGGEG
jgi:para-aminobenzoate synthetase component 1